MRHNRRTKRFNRSYGERQAMLENMVSSLLVHQQIQTTLEKAKAAKRLADRVITLGKNDTLHSRRLAFSHLQDHQLTSKLFKEVAPRFKSRVGGYTRILQLHRRKGDGAQMALLELTEKEIRVKEPKKTKKRPAPEAKAKEAPQAPKQPVEKSAKPKGGFFKNLGKFFRNKGGG
ncbi:MAG: 50S ribosomal protein L17 [Omnitrophica bacterium RIFCSPHIGHO2_02_FULL_63_14]|nr:MAG: 50S ribosomal protein L17 [Omnitrophica bacterium RIFCSPHIGHO2_02_FULL_63_14]